MLERNTCLGSYVAISKPETSNHAMQRTATRCAITFSMIKTFPLRFVLALGSRS
jgi:hypothetical protein